MTNWTREVPREDGRYLYTRDAWRDMPGQSTAVVVWNITPAMREVTLPTMPTDAWWGDRVDLPGETAPDEVVLLNPELEELKQNVAAKTKPLRDAIQQLTEDWSRACAELNSTFDELVKTLQGKKPQRRSDKETE